MTQDTRLNIDAEIAQLRVAAIILFIYTLGLISRQKWLLSVKWWYCQETVGVRRDGKGRNLFYSMDEFAEFMKVVTLRNGGL
ncbi:MAG: hypothetical protein NT070_18640 [Cyanobacteria bacterium]|nr:hypothetical protein [Cyanobacteriota bacterium]